METAKAGILERLEGFLAKHGRQDDLGLRLRGEQLARGIRFLRLVREGRYDIVVGNPPYQGTSKMADSKYIEKQYKLRQGGLICGVPAARSRAGARGWRFGAAHDAELDVHQAVLGTARALVGRI